jgi:hypothetical protein
VIVLAWAAVLGVLASAAPGRHPVTRITIEHGCFGCATGSELVLRDDGTATETIVGNARHGTTDRVSTGAVARKDLDRLSALLEDKRFFALDDEYADPDTADGAWTTITVVRGSEEKKVTRRGVPGPPALQAIESALRSLRERLVLSPIP